MLRSVILPLLLLLGPPGRTSTQEPQGSSPLQTDLPSVAPPNPVDAYMGANRVPALEQVVSKMYPRQAGTPIPVAHAEEDLNHLFAKVEEVHPDHLGAFPDPETYTRLKVWGHQAIQRLSRDGVISTLDFLYLLRCCTASFRDGHTRMELYWDGSLERHLLTRAGFPPILLASVDGRWIVRAATKNLQDILGQPIAEIQGQPVELFLRPAFLAISAETRGYRDSAMESHETTLYLLSGLLDGLTSVEITLTDGRRFQGPVLRYRDYQSLSNGVNTAAPKSSFRLLGPRTALFDYRSFDASPEGLSIIQSAFRFAIERKAENLIIDLRRNGGGNSNAGDEMIRYFGGSPYRMVRKTVVRISNEMERWLTRHWRDRPERVARFREQWTSLKAHLGESLTEDEPEEMPQPSASFFPGRVFVLTGPGTFSSASDFASVVKAYRLGTILGYETGGLWSCHGDVITMNLPRSGYPFGVSFKTFYGPKEIPDEFHRGTVPDVPASEAVLAPYAKEPDPLLAWALAVIEGGPQ